MSTTGQFQESVSNAIRKSTHFTLTFGIVLESKTAPRQVNPKQMVTEENDKERHWVVELVVDEVKEGKGLNFLIKSFVKTKVAYENILKGNHPT